MKRAINIVMIVAIALQSAGCSTWKPLARVDEVPYDDRQTSMRDQVLGKLTEGMRVRIRTRDGSPTPVIGQVIECDIEKVGPTSLTVVASTRFGFADDLNLRLTLRYSDIESVEYRKSTRGLDTFVFGALIGTILGLYLLGRAFSGITLD